MFTSWSNSIRLASCIAAVALTSTARGSSARPGTAHAEDTALRQIVAFAIGHAPSLAKARVSEQLADLQAKNAEAKLYPAVDLTTSQGLKRTMPEPWPAPSSMLFGQAGLAVLETFYDSGQTVVGIDLAKTNLEVAKLTTQKTRDDLILEVVKAFYTVLQADLALKTKVEQRALLNKQFSQTVRMYHQGLRTQKDYWRWQSLIKKSEIDVDAADAAKRDAETALVRVIGASDEAQLPSLAAVSPSEILKATPVIPKTIPAIAKSYTYRIVTASDQAAGYTVDLARLKNGPMLTVSAGLNYLIPDYLGHYVPEQPLADGSDEPPLSPVTTNSQGTLSWNLTVGLTYNLWDHGTRRREVEIAAAQRQIQNEETRASLLQLAADYRTLMDSLVNLDKTLTLYRQLLALEEKTYASLSADYRQGKVAYLDLVTGLSDLIQAKVSVYSTYISIRQALAQYQYDEGTLYDAMANS